MNEITKPRIVIYGVGQYGQFVTRFAADKGWPIVAAFNRAGDKVGEDLGELSGIGNIGVIVQDCDTASYDNLDADIGVVAMTNQLSVNHDAHIRLLSAGLNVVCHGSESYYPQGNDPEIAAKLDSLAKANNVTFTGSGIWDMSRIWSGILLSGPNTEINSLLHTSITDATKQVIGVEQLKFIGVGLTVEQFKENGLDKSFVSQSYKTIVEHVLVALGYTVSSEKAYCEPVVFDEDYNSEFMGCVIPAGHCVGSRVIADVGTEEGVTARSEIDLRLFQEGEVEHMFWEMDGKPRSRIRLEREDPAHATAGCLFNRIPDVISAEPGIVPVYKLGPLQHSALI